MYPKKASDVLRSRGFWNAVVGSAIMAFVYAAFNALGWQVPTELALSITSGFGLNGLGYKMQDVRNAGTVKLAPTIGAVTVSGAATDIMVDG